MQKVLVFDTFHSRKEDCRITKDILREYDRLFDAQANDSLQAYLEMNHGRHMAGAEYIWKYRLNSSARILYTFGKHVPYIRDEEAEAIVLLDYETDHDAQGRTAKLMNLDVHHDYEEIGELHRRLHNILENPETASDEDIGAAIDMLKPEFESSATIRVFDPARYSEDDNIEELEAYLTNEQRECYMTFIKDPCPTLVMGGAGSGKTLVAEYVLSSCKEDRVIYFTQSEALRKKALEDYKKFSGKNYRESIRFCNINNFAIKLLGWDESKFVGYKQFERIILPDEDIRELTRRKISLQDLWTEIRGTIKGALSSDWTRTAPISQQSFSKAPELIKKGYLKRIGNSQDLRLTAPVYEIVSKMSGDPSLSQEGRSQLRTITQYFSSIDNDQRMMWRSEYLALKEDSSTLDKEDREFVYSICEKYDSYLQENDLFDDNDLARTLLTKLPEAENLFDLIVIDEVQDYTEMQIKLAVELCKGQSILLAGDEHQIINPTMFRESRIRDLFYDPKTNKSPLVTKRLVKNFRCPQGPVEFSNVVSKLRKEKVASLSAISEQPEYSDRKGFKPFRMANSEDSVRAMVETLIRFPRTAVLVATEEDRQALIELIGQSEYEAAGNPVISTIPEIKGVEYRYVLCYNLFGAYKDRWEEIMAAKHPSGRTRDRYYFNMVYVATTRTLETVTYVDSYWNPVLENKLPFVDIEEFNFDSLRLDRLTNTAQDWIDAGREYENNGKYELAINCYQKGNAGPEVINNCYIALYKENHDYEAAMKYSLLIGDLAGANSMAQHIDSGKDIYRLVKYLNGELKATNAKDITVWISSSYESFTDEERDTIYGVAIETIDARLYERGV